MNGSVRNAPGAGPIPVSPLPSSIGPYVTWLGYAQRLYLICLWPGGRAECACAGSADKRRQPSVRRTTKTRIALVTRWFTLGFLACELPEIWLSFANDPCAGKGNRHSEPGPGGCLRGTPRTGRNPGSGAAQDGAGSRSRFDRDPGRIDQPPRPFHGTGPAAGDAAAGYR